MSDNKTIEEQLMQSLTGKNPEQREEQKKRAILSNIEDHFIWLKKELVGPKINLLDTSDLFNLEKMIRSLRTKIDIPSETTNQLPPC